MPRPLCTICNQNPSAINYIRKDKIHYRKLCPVCIRKGKRIKPIPPTWYKVGYRKKDKCERCGFRAKFIEKQMTVFHIDGNLKNNQEPNLRTICLNCRVEIAHSTLIWKESDIKPDF